MEAQVCFCMKFNVLHWSKVQSIFRYFHISCQEQIELAVKKIVSLLNSAWKDKHHDEFCKMAIGL